MSITPAWQPIAIYDEMKKKPKICVFRFAPSPHPRNCGLPEMFDISRVRGNRICTHFFHVGDFEVVE